MKPINEVYPEEAKEEQEHGYFRYGGPCDYTPMLESIGFEIILQVDDEDCEGDSRLIFRDGERYGILIFGWGSCSGCDSLQSCTTMKEVAELRDSLFYDIKWFSSKKECLVYFENHDWEGDFSWFNDKTRLFIKDGKAILSD